MAKALWKCMVKGCNYTAPPTKKGFKQVVGHMLGHSSEGLPKEERVYALIDEDTGNVLANKIGEAVGKGLLLEQEEPKKPVEVAEDKLEVEEEEELVDSLAVSKVEEQEEEEAREVTTPEITDGLIRYTVTLPADAFTLFNVARGYGLEEKNKLFDEFLFDCVTKRFEKDYRMRLILAPIEE